MLEYNVAEKLMKEKNRTGTVFPDLTRICELEVSVNDWRDYRVGQEFSWQPPLSAFKPIFTIPSIEYSQVDLTVFKIYLQASQRGTRRDSQS